MRGGVKVNALPENAWAVVKHWITTDGTSAELRVHEESRPIGM